MHAPTCSHSLGNRNRITPIHKKEFTIQSGDEAIEAISRIEMEIEVILEHCYMYESQEDTVSNAATMEIRDLGMKAGDLLQQIKRMISDGMCPAPTTDPIEIKEQLDELKESRGEDYR